jgi:hypothetical protein
MRTENRMKLPSDLGKYLSSCDRASNRTIINATAFTVVLDADLQAADIPQQRNELRLAHYFLRQAY